MEGEREKERGKGPYSLVCSERVLLMLLLLLLLCTRRSPLRGFRPVGLPLWGVVVGEMGGEVGLGMSQLGGWGRELKVRGEPRFNKTWRCRGSGSEEHTERKSRARWVVCCAQSRASRS